MKFIKMHGAGNDYIFIDCLDMTVDNMEVLAVEMSKRHFGVGGDGVVYLYPSFIADVRMRMFNADGSEGAMCGNAVRCIAALLKERTGKSSFTVETKAGIKEIDYVGDDMYRVNMGKPVIGEVNKPIFVSGKQFKYTYVSMGNPHCVIMIDSFFGFDISIGQALEAHSYFEDGINVEFVKLIGSGLKVRVWERGSGETLACGTGACAAVAACVSQGLLTTGKDIDVSLPGGKLIVNYSDNIYLTGNAVKIYEGDFYDKVHFCNGRSGQRLR